MLQLTHRDNSQPDLRQRLTKWWTDRQGHQYSWHYSPPQCPPPPAFLPRLQEPGVWGVFAGRKIYHLPQLFFKRTLRRHEWTDLGDAFLVQPTATMPQRYHTDVAVQAYLREHTAIPLPTMTTCFEDDAAMCLAMEFLPGVQMDELPEADRQIVAAELSHHLETLKSLRSATPGVPGESLLIAPQRVNTYHWHYHSCWRPRPHLTDGGGGLRLLPQRPRPTQRACGPGDAQDHGHRGLGVWRVLAGVV